MSYLDYSPALLSDFKKMIFYIAKISFVIFFGKNICQQFTKIHRKIILMGQKYIKKFIIADLFQSQNLVQIQTNLAPTVIFGVEAPP